MKSLAEKGRYGDTVLGHLTNGELVVPKDFIEDPEIYAVIKSIFDEQDVEMERYIVGNSENSINPETGLPEFFLSKIFRKIFGIKKPKLPPVRKVPSAKESAKEIRANRKEDKQAYAAYAGRPNTMLSQTQGDDEGGVATKELMGAGSGKKKKKAY